MPPEVRNAPVRGGILAGLLLFAAIVAGRFGQGLWGGGGL